MPLFDMQKRSVYFVVVLLLLVPGLGACRPGEEAVSTRAPAAAVPTTTVSPAATPTEAAATATATEAVPVPQATITPSPLPATDTIPAPAVLDVAWENRELFAPGLIPSQQAALDALPGATVYHLDLSLSADLTSLTGEQELLYTNREEVTLDEIYFRLFPNLAGGESTVSGVEVNGRAVTPVPELQRSALRVPLPAPLAPGEQVVIRLSFEVTVPVEGGGNYGTFIFDEGVLALAHFYPMVAVYDDEGWNVEIAPQHGDVVYADSSFYMVRVTAPAGVELVASGIAVAEEEVDGRQTVTYAAGPMRDFYLVASERFVSISRQVGETTINSYTLPEYESGAAVALAHAVAATENFNEIFGVYPFTEMDLASTPTLALGVEYPGAMVLAVRLYDPAEGYPATALEATTVHEVAHQWFYSTVGNDQIDEPWLDEALAQYATLLYFRAIHGEAGADAFRRSLTGRWERLEMAEIPIGMPVDAYDGAAYGAIVYGRGPLFFEALEERMGPAAFDDFLRTYYQRYVWEIATTEDLRAVAEQVCACDLGALFEEWVYPE